MADSITASFDALRRDPAARERAIRVLWNLPAQAARPRQAYLHAIIDTARDERIYPALRRLAATEDVVCLYQGEAARELASVAPYLVSLGISDRVFDWLWHEGWGDHRGIFVWSLVSVTTLRDHFRRLTTVQTEDNRRLLFRFYDPRVLGVFLPTCDAGQLKAMFGTAVSRFLVPAQDGARLDAFHLEGAALVTATHAIAG